MNDTFTQNETTAASSGHTSPGRRAARSRGSVVVLLLGLAALLSGPANASDNPIATDVVTGATAWLGPDGLPIPLHEDALLHFLETAPIVKSKRLSTGINRPLKVQLEQDGIVVNAVFRSVEESRSRLGSRQSVDRYLFRDSYIFEVAAYRLSRALGLHRVPPAALRRVDGREGSIQLWLESARTESDLVASPLGRRGKTDRFMQRQTMLAFDNLIYNFDRHLANRLYDDAGRLWMIDHTRSFKRLPDLPDTKGLYFVDPIFLKSLRAIEVSQLRSLVEPYIGKLELGALLQRRKQLLRHFDDLIAQRGADAVFAPLSA